MFKEGLKGTLMPKMVRFAASVDLMASSKTLETNDVTDWLASPTDTFPKQSFYQTLSSGDPLTFAPHS